MVRGDIYMSEIKEITLNGVGHNLGNVIPAENVSETTISDDLNLLDETWEDGKRIDPYTGQESTQYPQYTLTDYYALSDGGTVTALSTVNNTTFTVCCYDAAKAWLGNVDSGYMTKNVEKVVSPKTNTAYIRVYTLINTKSNFTYIKMPFSYTLRDWTDTASNRMNQLAVRADIYSKIAALEALFFNYKKWEGKYIVADGNSLVATSNWIATTCSFLGAHAVNVGKSGGAITAPNQPSSSATIAEKQAYIRNNIANNYPAKADLILLQESSYLDGEYSDQMDGPNPSDSWCARMNYFIRCLKTKYPNVLIALMPDPTWYTVGSGAAGNDSTTNTSIGDFIFNSRNANSLIKMRGLAEYNRLAFFDVDHSTPFNPLQKTNYYAQYYWLHEDYPSIGQDGVHPYKPYNTAKGYALAHFMAGLIFNPNAHNDAVDNWQDLVYTINSDGSCNYPNIGTPES